MNKTISLGLSILSFALLQACGGGGDGSAAAESTSAAGATGTDGTSVPATSANTGSVSAPFSAGASARYQLTSANGQSFGSLTTQVQASDGAMTTLNTNVLGGNLVVKDISGDANYVMGRWSAGTLTTSSGSTTLTDTNGSGYHYIAFNAPTVLPTSGTLACDAGTFTSPTYASGGSGSSGRATGSASLSFGTKGAVVGGTINVAAGGSNGSVSLNGTVSTPTSSAITGAYLGNGAGAAIQVGDAGSGAYFVVSSYAATLANGFRYFGVAKFRCA